MNRSVSILGTVSGIIFLIAIMTESVSITLSDTLYSFAGLIWVGLSLYAFIELISGKESK